MEQTLSISQFTLPFPKNSIRKRTRKRNKLCSVLSQTIHTPFTFWEINPSISSYHEITPYTYDEALRDPTNSKSLSSLKQTHAQILKASYNWNSEKTMSKLIKMYLHFEDYKLAASVFYMALSFKALTWNYIIEILLGEEKNTYGMFVIFRELHRLKSEFSMRFLVTILRICTEYSELNIGLLIHASLVKLGLNTETYIKCSLLEFYANCISLKSSHQLFYETPVTDPVLWNKFISLNVDKELDSKSIKIFNEMHYFGLSGDAITISKVLHACGKIEALKQGEAIHAQVIKSDLISHPLVSNSLITMYSKNSSIDNAKRVFERIDDKSLVTWNSIISSCSLKGFMNHALDLLNDMTNLGIKPDVVTWNCILSGYSRHGHDYKVFEILRMIIKEGWKPNSSTFTRVLTSISKLGLISYGKEIHAFAIRNGMGSNIYIGTSLIDMYLKCGKLIMSQRVFDIMKNKNTFTWNSLISGYAREGKLEKALSLVKQMESKGLKTDLATWNGLISGLAVEGFSTQVMLLIRRMKSNGLKPNVISWTALVSGCSQKEQFEESLFFLSEMIKEGVKPNSSTIAVSLRSCAGISLLKKGMELHCSAIRNGFDSDIYVATALIDMYSKSGGLRNAYRVFRKIKNKNLASWNAMMTGFATYGHGRDAIKLFEEMRRFDVLPDGITFTAVLSGCRHAGLIDEAWKYFDQMQSTYNMSPTIEQYTCMIDLLAKKGYFDEAMDLINKMPVEPDASVWSAILSACRINKNLEMAEKSAKKLFKLEPYNTANYLIMISLYASKGRWEDVEDVKIAMSALGLRNNGGWSWIQIKQEIHLFDVEKSDHPAMGEIQYSLFWLMHDMRKLGYVPDTNCVIQNIPTEAKEKLLLRHTEKLAITYGLVCTDKNVPIRVVKSSRVCNDCHNWAKYLSRLEEREIFLRDGVRYHHIVNGKCSCNDYW
ncbi:hypothetical protein LUZ60_008345 [Juncus effusus]|nr:hypothetical protein LUZ60_008345 [Juncus effusus]